MSWQFKDSESKLWWRKCDFAFFTFTVVCNTFVSLNKRHTWWLDDIHIFKTTPYSSYLFVFPLQWKNVMHMESEWYSTGVSWVNCGNTFVSSTTHRCSYPNFKLPNTLIPIYQSTIFNLYLFFSHLYCIFRTFLQRNN